MDIKIDINPEDVQQAVVNAIIKSSIGEAITKTVEDRVKELTSSYNGALKTIVDQEIKRQIQNVLMREEFAAPIRERIKAVMAEQLSDVVIGNMINKAFEL